MVNDFLERRKFGRRAAFKPAVAVLQSGERISGIVIDISEGGARFKTDDPRLIPKDILLEIPADDFIVKCVVVHTLADSIGVEFVASPTKISWLTAVKRKHFFQKI